MFVLPYLSPIADAAGTRWHVDATAVDARGTPRPTAEISSDTGDRVRIYRTAANRVWLSYRLRPGTEQLDPSVCPTYQILDATASAPHVAAPCAVDKRGIRFAVGDVTDQTLRSSLTRGLMDGRELAVIIKLRKMGY